jgi:tetratricopeptide (TPR) repeat protein
MMEPGRAANIPEFVALPADAIVKIREQFLDDTSYVRAGDEFYRAGEVDNAIEKYRIALSLNPDNAAAHRPLGTLLYRTNHREEALDHMRAAVRLDPRDLPARFNLGLACSGSGDHSNAIVHLEEAVRRLSLESDRQYGAVDAKPAFPEALHFNLGSVYEQAGDLTEAEHHYREASRLARDYPQAHNSLGLLLLRSGRVAEAEEHFAEVIKLLPGFAQAHNCLGIVRQRQNRMAEALTCFQKAVQCDTNDWQAHLNLAYAYLAEGNRDKAIPELQETLRIKPSFEPAQQALGKALGEAAPNAR